MKKRKEKVNAADDTAGENTALSAEVKESGKKHRFNPWVFLVVLLVLCLAGSGWVSYSLWKSYNAAEAELVSALNADEVELGLRTLANSLARRTEAEKLRSSQEEKELRTEMTQTLLAEERMKLLVLVNPWNTVPENWTVDLVTVAEERQVDSRCSDALLKMIADCNAAGNWVRIISAYRTQEYQQMLFSDKVQRELQMGYGYEQALELAAAEVAVPGTSEHQLGLTVDLTDYWYVGLDNWQMNTSTQRWLMEHSWEYGFILRYPQGTSEITGIIFEPWHYRFVGRVAAKEIHDAGITLEEYLEGLNSAA